MLVVYVQGVKPVRCLQPIAAVRRLGEDTSIFVDGMLVVEEILEAS